MAAAVVEARERRLAASPAAPPNDLVTVLLAAGETKPGRRLRKEEITSNIFTLFVAGLEPIAIAVTWALYLLSLDPEWQERLETEADRELPDGRYVEGSLKRLIETRAVIEETLRLYPPIATINRQAIAADELAGYAIAPGTIVIIAPWVLHRHRLLWEGSDHFDPSRFLPGARETIDRFAYLPFGAGPRTCVGGSFSLQAATIVLATLLRWFRLELAPGHQAWPVHRVFLRTQGGLPMILHRRQWPGRGQIEAKRAIASG
jgi:cytochrome P450